MVIKESCVWHITEIEEKYELRSGIEHVGQQIMDNLIKIDKGLTEHYIHGLGGVPMVLFMENYDINRSGYHDTKGTMENIDLDYGAAFAAIAIEMAARIGCLLFGDI